MEGVLGQILHAVGTLVEVKSGELDPFLVLEMLVQESSKTDSVFRDYLICQRGLTGRKVLFRRMS